MSASGEMLRSGDTANSEEVLHILSALEEANHIASMTGLEDLLKQMLQLMDRLSEATNCYNNPILPYIASLGGRDA